MGRITVRSDTHLMVVTYDGVVGDAEFAQHLEGLTQLLAERAHSVATILDASTAGVNPATQRRMQAEWLKAHDSVLQATGLGTAIVIRSALVRGILTAILWMAPIPGDHVVFPTYAEAEEWALRQIREAGLPAPPPRL